MTDEPAQPPPEDPNRRRFFRLFAGDVMSSVGTVIGAAQVLQRESAEAARELLGDSEAIDFLGGPPAAAPVHDPREMPAAGAGYRTPLRWEGDACRVVDQRRLPDVLVEIDVEGAGDGVAAIRDEAIVGSAAQAQLAAVTLALTAGRTRTHRPFARRATIRGAANALKNVRPGSAAMHATVHRMLAVEEALGIEAEGDALAEAMHAEAEAILREATDAHGAVVELALAALPEPRPAPADTAPAAPADAPDGVPAANPGPAGVTPDPTDALPASPLRVLTIGSTGAMGGGQLGTALSAIIAAHHAGRAIEAMVAETRPGFEGSRIAAWELREAGVPHVVVTDAAAPGRIAAGDVDVVLVSADRVLAGGDVIAIAGTYPLALAASAAGIPFIVCVASIAVDEAPDTAPVNLEEGRSGPVTSAAGTRVAPEGTAARNPVQDRTPAALTTLVTEPRVARTEAVSAAEAATPSPTSSPAPSAEAVG
jgi:methylthioribose-1-phosphate isomerase